MPPRTRAHGHFGYINSSKSPPRKLPSASAILTFYLSVCWLSPKAKAGPFIKPPPFCTFNREQIYRASPRHPSRSLGPREPSPLPRIPRRRQDRVVPTNKAGRTPPTHPHSAPPIASWPQQKTNHLTPELWQHILS